MNPTPGRYEEALKKARQTYSDVSPPVLYFLLVGNLSSLFKSQNSHELISEISFGLALAPVLESATHWIPAPARRKVGAVDAPQLATSVLPTIGWT